MDGDARIACAEDRDFRRFRDAGSNEALARVFDALAPRLLLVAAHLAPDAAQAEDLVQTTFLQAVRDASRYDGERPVAAWLAGILRHRALDLRRRAARRRHEPLDEDAELPGREADPALLAEDDELFERLRKAIDELEPPYREVLNLRLVHGLAPRSIAHSLGRPPGTVRMQLKRGLERLRPALPERAAPALALFLEPTRGLEAIKQSVLKQSVLEAAPATGPVAGTLTPAVSGLLGGTWIVKSWIIAATVLVAGIGAFALWGGGELEGEPALAGESTGVAPVAAAAPASGGEELAPTARATAEERDVRTAVAESEETPAATGLRLRVLFASDGSPAEDVGVHLRSAEGAELGHELRTDDAGRVRFDDLADGRHRLLVDRLEQAVEVETPREEEFELRIPAGVHVEGRVLDLEDAPVAGATIYRFDPRHPDALQAVGSSDGAGRFELRDVAPRTELLARAVGWQPSELEDVRGKAGERVELELVMGARGQRLRGRVLDPEGQPVPFAFVAFGVDEDAREELEGSDEEPAAEERGKAMDLEGILLRADAAGRFDSREVPGGWALVLARPADSASELLAHGTLWVVAGEENEVELRLLRGGVVEGVVRDAAGQPVAGVEVEAEWEGTPRLGQMEDDVGPRMSDRFTRSAEDGSYRLAGLLAGDYDLRVNGERTELARTERLIGEAEVVRWDPVVEAHAFLALRLIGPDGEPLVGWHAQAKPRLEGGMDGSFFRQRSDDGGRMRLLDLEGGQPHAVFFYAPDDEGRISAWPTLRLAGLVPGEEEQEVRLEAYMLSLGAITGRVVDEAGSASTGASVQAELRGSGASKTVQLGEDGGFRFEELPAGEYALRLSGSRELLATVDLAPGELVELEPLHLEGQR